MVLERPDFKLTVAAGADHHGLRQDGNYDFWLTLPDGSDYSGTFFTLESITTLMNRNAESGECAHNAYFCCVNMVIVREMTPECLIKAATGLISERDFEWALIRSVGDN